MLKFPVMYWYGPKSITEKNAAEIAAAGFNLIPVCGTHSSDIKSQAQICANHGINIMVQDNRIFKAVQSKENREKLLADVAADYAGIPNIVSYYITDEPSCDEFAALKQTCDILNSLDRERETYINLFPNYASDEQLKCKGYREHIDRYMKEVSPSIISYDHYNFTGRFDNVNLEATSEDEREQLIIKAAWNSSDRAGFFDNIEIIREKSLETGIPFMVIILLVEHGPYRNLSEAEIRWEVFQSLAYGSCRISYFTYMTVDSIDGWKWANGMQNIDGTLARHYYDVKKINSEIQVAGNIVNSNKSIGVYHIGEEPDKSIKQYKPCGAIESVRTTSPLTLGFFENGYILAANKDYQKVSKVDIKLCDDKKLLVTDKVSGDTYFLNPVVDTDNTYTIYLMPGDGEILQIR